MHQVVVSRRLRRRAQVVGAAGLSVALALTVTSAASPSAATRTHPSGHAQSHADTPAVAGKQAVARGTGGAVSSVDADASRIGLEVLRAGGTAADAAVATAAALGVTEPYSAGIGGGGYFVYYDARSGKVTTIDGRETAPQAMPSNAFIVPGSVSATAPYGVAYPFADLV